MCVSCLQESCRSLQCEVALGLYRMISFSPIPKAEYLPMGKSLKLVVCDIIFPFLQELHQWSAQLQLVEVKRNAGCQLTEMANELAELGCASAEEPVFPGKLKYCSLLLHIQASMLTLIARVSRREHSQKDFKLGGPRCSGCCTVQDRHRTGPSGWRAII